MRVGEELYCIANGCFDEVVTVRRVTCPESLCGAVRNAPCQSKDGAERRDAHPARWKALEEVSRAERLALDADRLSRGLYVHPDRIRALEEHRDSER